VNVCLSALHEAGVQILLLLTLRQAPAPSQVPSLPHGLVAVSSVHVFVRILTARYRGAGTIGLTGERLDAGIAPGARAGATDTVHAVSASTVAFGRAGCADGQRHERIGSGRRSIDRGIGHLGAPSAAGRIPTTGAAGNIPARSDAARIPATGAAAGIPTSSSESHAPDDAQQGTRSQAASNRSSDSPLERCPGTSRNRNGPRRWKRQGDSSLTCASGPGGHASACDGGARSFRLPREAHGGWSCKRGAPCKTTFGLGSPTKTGRPGAPLRWSDEETIS